MAVVQPTKNKVQPVLDYPELNKYITCYSGWDAIDVCGETLRVWRQITGASKIVDLKSPYQQIHIARHLRKYQLVRYKEQTYCLIRLGFALNVALKIMSAILKAVLKISTICLPSSANLIKLYRKEQSLITTGGIRTLKPLPNKLTCLNPYELEKRFGLNHLTPTARRNRKAEELLECRHRTL